MPIKVQTRELNQMQTILQDQIENWATICSKMVLWLSLAV
ncbi:hypothetical protein SP38_65 [Salmonella phage 38]|uniref:Uncharacterized protein n=1 Tax=Salmonella phage 38 TaxID=1654891 RepID=A0A0N7CFG1_9CAUD|nr:hypothetical protein SP38_65 [Salmonella phage 38]AKJ73667.1 hypothetical protein SP38_65 [Salmonella phage 38]